MADIQTGEWEDPADDDEPEEEAPEESISLADGGFTLRGSFMLPDWIGSHIRVVADKPEPAKEPEAAASPVPLYGAHILREMSKDMLIEELMGYQRTELHRKPVEQLRVYVANSRLMRYKERLMEEANISPHDYPF